jgi:hypothetical protein
MTFRSLFLLGAMVVATGAAAQTQPRTKAKVGVNTKNPTENLHVNGTLRVQKLPANGTANAISTKADGTGSTDVDQRFNAQYVVTADKNGVLGRVSSIETKLFYMPAVHLPLTEEELALNPSNPSYLSHFTPGYSPTYGFQIGLYSLFAHQFDISPNFDATQIVKSDPSAALWKANWGYVGTDFDYFITYYDTEVFENVSVTDDGLLRYKVKAGAVPTAKTYMNILLKKKDQP